MKLFTLEIKRVLRTRTTWLLLAASLVLSGIMAWLPVTFESRYIGGLDGVEQTEVRGMAAIRLVRDAQADLSGVITREQMKNVLESAQRTLKDAGEAYTYLLPPGVYQEKILPIAPLLPRITEVYADPETGMAPGLTDLAPERLEHYYESCVTHLDDLMKLEQKEHPAAQEKARALYAKVNMPFVFYPGYNSNAYDYQMLLIFLVVLFCTVIAAPVFSAEYQTQADDILRCTKYGKARLAGVKLLSALLITSAAFLCSAAVYLLLSNSFFGWDMLKTSIQLVFFSVSLGSMNIGQLQLAVAAAGLASLFASISFTLFLSSRCKNTVTALSLALLFFLAPIILFMASSGNAVSWLRCLLPSGGVSILGGFAGEITDFNFLHLGNFSVWSPYVIITASLIEIPVFLAAAAWSYCRHSQ